MRDKYNRKVKIGDAVRCKSDYSFDPSEGIVIARHKIKIYKSLNPDDLNYNLWKECGGVWSYFIAFKEGKVEKISKRNYYLSRLKE